jgi:protein phosphatase
LKISCFLVWGFNPGTALMPPAIALIEKFAVNTDTIFTAQFLRQFIQLLPGGGACTLCVRLMGITGRRRRRWRGRTDEGLRHATALAEATACAVPYRGGAFDSPALAPSLQDIDAARYQGGCMKPADYGHASHTGWLRECNEDSYLADPELGLWIVADGLGGEADGEVASAIVVAHVVERVRAGLPLDQAITTAHTAVLEAVREGRGKAGMGSTAVGAHIRENVYQIAWIGDSRAYLWDGRHIARLTRDHSFVQELVDSGALREEVAALHPYRNVLTRCLGSSDGSSVRVDTVTGELYRDDRILLCSDGLTGELSDADIEAVFAAGQGVQETVDRLIEGALERGGSDNVTVLAIAAPADARPRTGMA